MIDMPVIHIWWTSIIIAIALGGLFDLAQRGVLWVRVMVRVKFTVSVRITIRARVRVRSAPGERVGHG